MPYSEITRMEAVQRIDKRCLPFAWGSVSQAVPRTNRKMLADTIPVDQIASRILYLFADAG